MGNKLLLADDSITIQKVVGIIFANEDYELTVVDNGIAALEKAREVIPDIILIDALMPGKNGYEVCEEVRRDPALNHVPLLLLTGAFEPFDEKRARQCGADDFISKPFESQNLIDKVRALIAKGKERAKMQPEPASIALASAREESPLTDARKMTSAAPAAVMPISETAGETAEDFFTVAEEAGNDFFVTDLADTEEVVEVAPTEDLWGAFDIEEVPEDEAFAFEETAEAVSVETVAGLTTEEEDFFAKEEPGPADAGTEQFAAPQEFIPPGEPATEDFFSFVDEPGPLETMAETALQGAPVEEDIFAFVEEAPGPAESEATLLAAPQEFIPPAEPAMDDFFSFAEETPTAESDAVPGMETFGVESGDMVPGIETTEEFLASAAAPHPVVEEKIEVPSLSLAAVSEVEQQFAPEEEDVPTLDVPLAAPVAAVPSSVTGEVTLSDEQLSALVSRISRDILEKIAWEVVPDLAERIIREEIRKIKEGH